MEHKFEKYCQNCGAVIDKDALFCPKCGKKQYDPETEKRNDNNNTLNLSTINKDWLITLLLCFFTGALGIHRFYNGKIATGILMLITAGGLGIWYVVDLIIIIFGKFTDKNGNYISVN
ncbi:MAG: TM2 domain-containing protein [Bacteroidales bacterium]|nr:TM2 domain-containing protein [Bacteroidales bacterium]